VSDGGSAWSPLRRPLYRSLWLAALASNVGTWMHDTSAAWMMTSLSTSPLVVALMQTAASLPFFLLALPGGALADVVDRRRVLVATQLWMMAAAVALGLLTVLGGVTPAGLLALTFTLGMGAAVNAPAWQAVTPEVVPRTELAPAIALNGVAVNVARAVGPALGGVVAAAAGPAAVFFLNAASFAGIVAVLLRWRRAADAPTVPAEDVLGAMRAGARYVRHASAFRTVLARTSLFIVSASAVWALLPVLARRQLGLDAAGYGVLLGSLGAGAILGAAALPVLRKRLVTVDRLLAAATVAFAVTSLTLALVRSVPVAVAALVLGGVAWVATMSSLSVAAQTTVPAWVRARALAVSLLVVQGGLAGGSVVWGTVAGHAGVPAALGVAAAGLIVGGILARRYRLADVEQLDLRPALRVPAPVVDGAIDADDGPVLVVLTYEVEPQDARAFVAALHELERIRRRDGAYRWAVFRDAAAPTRWIETFLVDTWGEHLRQHHRATEADEAVKARVRSFTAGGAPAVAHYVAPGVLPG
jgi:MFS family permease